MIGGLYDYIMQPSEKEVLANKARQSAALNQTLGPAIQSPAGMFSPAGQMPQGPMSMASPQQMPTGATSRQSLMDLLGQNLQEQYRTPGHAARMMPMQAPEMLASGQGMMGVNKGLKGKLIDLMAAMSGGGGMQ